MGRVPESPTQPEGFYPKKYLQTRKILKIPQFIYYRKTLISVSVMSKKNLALIKNALIKYLLRELIKTRTIARIIR